MSRIREQSWGAEWENKIGEQNCGAKWRSKMEEQNGRRGKGNKEENGGKEGRK